MLKTAIGSEKYVIYSTETLLRAYQEGPQRIKKSIAGLDEKDFYEPVIPGKWTIGEILIHLADADIIGACRIRQAFASHPGDFPYYLEAVWADVLNYKSQSVDNIYLNLELFTLLRQTASNIFDSMSEADWLKEGIHPERGKMNLRGLLELYADHSERHLSQILERRKLLGKEIKMDIILKERLY